MQLSHLSVSEQATVRHTRPLCFLMFITQNNRLWLLLFSCLGHVFAPTSAFVKSICLLHLGDVLIYLHVCIRGVFSPRVVPRTSRYLCVSLSRLLSVFSWHNSLVKICTTHISYILLRMRQPSPELCLFLFCCIYPRFRCMIAHGCLYLR